VESGEGAVFGSRLFMDSLLFVQAANSAEGTFDMLESGWVYSPARVEEGHNKRRST